MVWAGISLHTKTPMIPIHQNLNEARNQNIIFQPVAIPHITANRGLVLMQDNATPHTARTNSRCCRDRIFEYLTGPLVVQTFTQLNMCGTRSTEE